MCLQLAFQLRNLDGSLFDHLDAVVVHLLDIDMHQFGQVAELCLEGGLELACLVRVDLRCSFATKLAQLCHHLIALALRPNLESGSLRYLKNLGGNAKN